MIAERRDFFNHSDSKSNPTADLVFTVLLLSSHNLTGVTFLQPCKKVTKEDGIGEALTAKPIATV